jgi:type I restriction enzyme S subunit
MLLKPYPKYRATDLPWLKEIPEHWEICRNGRLFLQRNETGFGSLPILEVSLKAGVRIRDMDNLKRKQVMADREGYKRAVCGDIAYNMMRMWQGAVGVAPVDGLVSPAYVVARPFPDNISKYFEYLFRTTAYMNEVDGYSRGIVKDRNRLYWQDFKRMPSCRPPLEEQNKIVAYIKTQETKIHKIVRAKRQMIELLKEQKQVFINQAVTKGIEPNVKLKSSGVDWHGDIPEHWEMRRLRTVSTVKPSGIDKNIVDGETAIFLCNYVDVYKNDYITPELSFMKATATQAEIDAFKLRTGDVIITKDSEDWADIAVPAYVVSDFDDVICAYHLAVVRSNKNLVSGEYLFRAFSSETIADQFRVSANGITRYGLSQNAIKSAVFPVPPIEEQEKIAEHIKGKCKEIEAAILKANREIELIQEYRTRLISDVVTGKVDVRDIAIESVVDIERSNDLEEIPKEEELSDLKEIKGI